MHLYERHFPLAERVLQNVTEADAMPRMTDLADLPHFVECERSLRSGEAPEQCLRRVRSTYWRSLLGALIEFQRNHHTAAACDSVQEETHSRATVA